MRPTRQKRGLLQAHLDRAQPCAERCYRAAIRTCRRRSDAVPFSSSFFAGRLLNVRHHEVRSRREEAGSGVASSAAWGSPLRTRGVWGLLCVAAGMAGRRGRGSALDAGVAGGSRGRRGVQRCCPGTRHRWVWSGQAAVWGRYVTLRGSERAREPPRGPGCGCGQGLQHRRLQEGQCAGQWAWAWARALALAASRWGSRDATA